MDPIRRLLHELQIKTGEVLLDEYIVVEWVTNVELSPLQDAFCQHVVELQLGFGSQAEVTCVFKRFILMSNPFF